MSNVESNTEQSQQELVLTNTIIKVSDLNYTLLTLTENYLLVGEARW